MSLFGRKKQAIDLEKVKTLGDLFYVSCALADLATEYGLVILAINNNVRLFVDTEDNVEIGLFFNQTIGSERINAIFQNPDRCFPCSYTYFKWYFDAMGQTLDSNRNYKIELNNLIPGLTINMEREYYKAIQIHLKKYLSSKAYSRIKFDDNDCLICFGTNL